MNIARLDSGGGIVRLWWVIPTLAIAGVLYVAIQLFTDPAAVVEERVLRDFPTTSTPTITVRSQAGRVSVRAVDGSTVRLKGTRRATAATRAEADRALRAMETGMQGGRSSLVVTSFMTRDVLGRAELVLELEVPRGSRLRIEQGDGPVRVEGVLGDMVITAASGDISVSLPQGRGFRLDGGGTLVSEFPLALAPPGNGFVTRDAAPQQELWLTALSRRVAITQKD